MRKTVPSLKQQKRLGQKITMVTAYDYAAAKIVDQAEVDMILVGDSVGMVMLGYDSTLAVTMDDMVHHVKAVRRGTSHALLVADMPYLSYGVDVRETIANAGRFVKECGAEAVKLEGGERVAADVRALVSMQIPVVGHLGLTPQSLNALGGYSVQAKSAELAAELLREAKVLEEAGVFSLVLEGIPREVAKEVTESLAIPTIGIGAGPDCDGQVLVYHDLLGLHDGHYAKFVRKYADGFSASLDAMKAYVDDVRSGAFPADAESYHLRATEASRLSVYTADDAGQRNGTSLTR